MLRHESESEPIDQALTNERMITGANPAPVVQQRAQREDAQLSLSDWAKQNAWSRSVKNFGRGVVGGALTFAMAFPTLLTLAYFFPSQPGFTFTVFLVMLAGGFLCVAASLVAMVYTAMNASAKLPMPARYDAGAIGDLLDRSLTDYSHNALIVARLTELLPDLRPGDDVLLAKRHYEILNAHIRRAARETRPVRPGTGPNGAAYLCAILQAYANVGDARALEDVQSIAAGKAASGLDDSACIDAARRCLPRLERAAQELRAKETLLRGAQPIPDNTLLRAAGPATPGRPDELLRPIDDELRLDAGNNA